MRFKILCVSMTAMLASISISSRADPVRDRPPDEEPVVEKTRLEPGLAYTKKRYVGLVKGTGPCPGVLGWNVESLRDSALRKVRESLDEQDPYGYRESEIGSRQPDIKPADDLLLRELKLDRYCIYTREDPSAGFLPPPNLEKHKQDRLALSTTSAGSLPSNGIGEKIWRDLATHATLQTGQQLRSQSGTSDLKPALRLKETRGLPTPREPKVRLTFIDSAPDGDKVPAKPGENESPHGFTLTRFAEDIVCPSGGPCAAKIATRRALGYRDFDPTKDKELPPDELADDKSGHVGLVSDLATTIVAEVLYWQQVEPEKKLILNLSLGWDGEAFGDLEKHKPSHLEPSVKAVYDALRLARRKGALVIAAAGNRRGGEQGSEWPLLPAAWELRRPTYFWCPFGPKPVYAIGGVDWQGLPLSNFRFGGRPRRVTYADHSVTHGENRDEPTAMYTGTSVSAAVASSIAAVIWHLRPDLKPAQVMRLMTRSGETLPTSKADFYAWKKPWLLSKLIAAPHPKRLTLCQAVERACGPDNKRCPALAERSNCPQDLTAPDLGSLLKDLKGNDVSLNFSPRPSPEQFIDGASLIDVTSQRWVFPQPEATPCPDCSVVPRPPPSFAGFPRQGYELVLEIGKEWQDEVLQSQSPGGDPIVIQGATLTILKGETSVKIYELEPEQYSAGEVHRILITGAGGSLSTHSVKLTFKVTVGTDLVSILNPVFVVP